MCMDLNDLFELNMLTCTWTQIQTDVITPRARCAASLHAISDGQLVLHGGCGRDIEFMDTWVMGSFISNMDAAPSKQRSSLL